MGKRLQPGKVLGYMVRVRDPFTGEDHWKQHSPYTYRHLRAETYVARQLQGLLYVVRVRRKV